MNYAAISMKLLCAVAEGRIPGKEYSKLLAVVTAKRWDRLHHLLGEMNFVGVPCDCAEYFAGAKEREWGWVHKNHQLANLAVWYLVVANHQLAEVRQHFAWFVLKTDSKKLRKYAQALLDHLFRENPDPAWVGEIAEENTTE